MKARFVMSSFLWAARFVVWTADAAVAVVSLCKALSGSVRAQKSVPGSGMPCILKTVRPRL
jgi:hypothetical protein